MENEFITTYKSKFASYELFTNKLKDLITSLLQKEKINYHLIEERTKSVESFSEKIERKKDKYSDPLSEITDLCGLRIILYYTDEIDKVDKLIRDNFNIDEPNSINKRTTLNEDQFGYLSYHYVISLNSSRINLPEWDNYKDFKAEIQVRTVLQHSWASISHALQYKKSFEVPSILKRKLFRLAGLFELADEEFQEIRDKNSEVEHSIKQQESIDNVRVFEELNLNTLKNYFGGFNINLNILSERIDELGFTTLEDDSYEDTSGRNLSELIWLSRFLKIKNVIEFDHFIKLRLDIAKEYLRKQKEANKDGEWSISVEFATIMLFMLYLSQEELKEYSQNTGIWSKSTLKRVVEVITNFKRKHEII
jgi:putative GTP pyrophosphokinase